MAAPSSAGSDGLPEAVRSALQSNPTCSLSIAESLSVRSEAGGGQATTVKRYFLLCPNKRDTLLEAVTTTRDLAPGEHVGGEAFCMPVPPIFGGSSSSSSGGGSSHDPFAHNLDAFFSQWQQHARHQAQQHAQAQAQQGQRQQGQPQQQQQQQPQPLRRPPYPGSIQV